MTEEHIKFESEIEEITEPILEVSKILRTHYLAIATAESIDERIDNMIVFVDQAKAFTKNIKEDWKKDIKEIELLVSLSGGKRTNLLVKKKLHYKLSKLIGKIMRDFYYKGKIVDKQIRIENIVMAQDGQPEGFAPAPPDFDLEEEYIKKKRKKENEKKDFI